MPDSLHPCGHTTADHKATDARLAEQWAAVDQNIRIRLLALGAALGNASEAAPLTDTDLANLRTIVDGLTRDALLHSTMLAGVAGFLPSSDVAARITALRMGS